MFESGMKIQAFYEFEFFNVLIGIMSLPELVTAGVILNCLPSRCPLPCGVDSQRLTGLLSPGVEGVGCASPDLCSAGGGGVPPDSGLPDAPLLSRGVRPVVPHLQQRADPPGGLAGGGQEGDQPRARSHLRPVQPALQTGDLSHISAVRLIALHHLTCLHPPPPGAN